MCAACSSLGVKDTNMVLEGEYDNVLQHCKFYCVLIIGYEKCKMGSFWNIRYWLKLNNQLTDKKSKWIKKANLIIFCLLWYECTMGKGFLQFIDVDIEKAKVWFLPNQININGVSVEKLPFPNKEGFYVCYQLQKLWKGHAVVFLAYKNKITCKKFW